MGVGCIYCDGASSDNSMPVDLDRGIQVIAIPESHGHDHVAVLAGVYCQVIFEEYREHGLIREGANSVQEIPQGGHVDSLIGRSGSPCGLEGGFSCGWSYKEGELLLARDRVVIDFVLGDEEFHSLEVVRYMEHVGCLLSVAEVWGDTTVHAFFNEFAFTHVTLKVQERDTA
jgi:hypothetical protein